MPVINGVYLKDFTALPSSVTDANIIPIAITGNQIAYRTTVGGIVTDARVTSKLLTGLSVTGGAVVATDTILQAFGKVQNQINSKVSSVGLTMPAAFSVANSPITSAGTLAVTAIGAASQYIRGDGALADFPTTGGGGSSVAYYLNGSVNQGTFVGNTYYEMNKTPVIGTGTDFTIGADGYIAQFITDANDPASLLIPAGNWNVEMYFSASSNGGTPSFYVEVYKYNGTTFTLLGSSATTPEGITNGTAIDIYYTSVGIPETVLTLTDRLAIRVYVTHSGRTITLHTEDNHLSEIVTTFSNGLTALNGLTKQAQYFAVGSAGTDFAIVSSVDTHTFNIPDASASNRGLITTGAQTIAGEKTFTTANRTIFTNADFFQVEFSNSSSKLNLGSSSGQSYIYSSGDLRFGTNYPTDTLSSPKLIIATSGLVTITNQLRLNSTITNGTYTYTLPSATGTLALTSALSGYVDLTTNQSIAGEKTFTDKLVVNFGASTSAAIQATSTNADGRALAVLATSTLEPFVVTQLGTGKIATFNQSNGVTNNERVAILNNGNIVTQGKVLIGTTSAGNGGVDSVVVRNSSDTELKIVGTTGTGSAVFSASPTFTGTVNAAAVTLTGALSGTSATFSGDLTIDTNTLYVDSTNNRVGIGVTTPGYPLQVTKTGVDSGVWGYNIAQFGDATTNASGLRVGTSVGTSGLTNLVAATNNDASQFAFWTWTGSTWGERMRITSGGAVGINTTTPGTQFEVISTAALNNAIKGTAGGSTGYGGLFYGSNGTTYAGLGQNGNAGVFIGGSVGIGTSDPFGLASSLVAIVGSGSTYNFLNIQDTVNANNAAFIQFINSAGSGIGGVTRVGTTNAVVFNTTSDRRLKKNIIPAKQLALPIINQIEINEFDWETGDRFEPFGVIAQDLHKIVPNAVTIPRKEEDSWMVDKSSLVPMLIKAVQELKAEIDLLKGEPIVPEVTPEPIIPTDNNLE